MLSVAKRVAFHVHSLLPCWYRVVVGRVLILTVMVLVGTGCVDPLDLDVDAPKPPPLVVDGIVTDGPGPHEVRLTRAAAYEQSLDGLHRSVSGATVTITDETTDERVRLDESARSGTYRSEAGALMGVPGHSYRLDVTLADGTRYHSSSETMPRPVPIDSLFVEFVSEPTPGFAVLVSADEPAGTPRFYRWSVRSTFEAPVLPEPRVPPFFCWADDGVGREISVRDDRLIDGGRIEQERVRFVPASGKTSLAYQVDVRQQTITRDAFDFWKTVETQVEQTGNTFAPPPSPVRGNIVNATNSEHQPLGFFSAAGQTVATVCIHARDFPEAPFTPIGRQDNTCNGGEVGFQRPAFWKCSVHRN